MGFLKGLNLDSLKSTLEAGVKTVQEGVANVDVDELVQGAKSSLEAGVKTVQESVANANVDDIVQSAKGALATGAEKLGGAVEGLTHQETDMVEEETSTKELVALLWCLAYVDGSITDEEKKMLEELSSSLDENFHSFAADVEQEYMAKLEEAGKEFGQANASKVEAQKIVESINMTAQEAKLLCWNLLALANSDELDQKELDFIRFVAKKAGVDSAVFEELRNYNDAIAEIGQEIEKLQNSARSYVEIKPLVEESILRQQAIIEAVQALISDR